MWKIALGFATGFGLGYLARELTQRDATSLRPTAKAVVRGAMSLADDVRGARERAAKALDGLVAEVRGERARPLAAASAASELLDEPLEVPVAVRRRREDTAAGKRNASPA